ncbi:DUF6397 family protein [Streptomyces sp. NBC_00876]|uniref:DUF6397 family protein n=1 Tax=Streptomyces sp. NBC_00876 TaxID=2975853 RepID=UPI0038693477|nr:DUF6397 family protein [Streptomyces sp. NBC_00876]
MPMTEAVRDDSAGMISASRAAGELGLRRGEFDLAVHLGAVGAEVRQGSGRPRVRREEIDRLRSEDGFPGTLQERVRTVGTAQGARLLGISPVRFARLARAGCVTPVAFYLNRYRAVVWLYLAQELGGLAARSPELLVGNSPPWMRSRLDAGVDCRPRNWRSRRIERLLALTADPWARAAVVAQGLDPVQLAEVVDDPYERAYFGRVRPEPVLGQRGSAAGRETMARLMLADEPDEILWRRVTLVMELDSARELRPAPRPGDERWPGPADEPVPVRSLEQGAPDEREVPSERAAQCEPVVPSERAAQCEPVVPSESAAQCEPAGPGGRREPVRPGGARGLLARIRLRTPHGNRRPREDTAPPGTARSAGRRRPGRSRALAKGRGGPERGSAGERD